MSAESQQAYRLMSQMSEHAPFISLKNLICLNEGSTEKCKVSVDGLPLYRDDGHLSINGSSYIGETNDLTGLITTTADAFWASK